MPAQVLFDLVSALPVIFDAPGCIDNMKAGYTGQKTNPFFIHSMQQFALWVLFFQLPLEAATGLGLFGYGQARTVFLSIETAFELVLFADAHRLRRTQLHMGLINYWITLGTVIVFSLTLVFGLDRD